MVLTCGSAGRPCDLRSARLEALSRMTAIADRPVVL